ncbi:hypothetical protein H1V43_37735 [Streptomyces sp. PSKA54]|uniref:Glycosyltransferase family 8 protein n=1 Tax=Streptomyces himalayensis subsp. aureolus TaxID=2758039 RepID=A0A7W2HK94_9ACTN|nr:glycosyltransferase [Streptomyces himalayensis]MBA4866940.1 hypothetical protein [Streptomyces himalayensis subsp. aureolus]
MHAFGLCVDERYLVPALTAITSLADGIGPATRRTTAVRVLALDLAPAHACLLAAIAKRVGFGSFDLRWARPAARALLVEGDYISVTTYLRFQFTPQFVRRPYLIYVDSDVLVRGDLSQPLDRLPADRVGAVRDEFNPSVGECPALPGLADRFPSVRGRPYYNAGVLWMHTATMNRVRSGAKWALTAGRRHILHNDQDALNLWLLAARAAHPVDPAFNRFEVARFLQRGDWVRRVVDRPLRADPRARLVHFVGPEKPWRSDCPATEEVREYRVHLRATLRHVRRLGAVGVESGAGGMR